MLFCLIAHIIFTLAPLLIAVSYQVVVVFRYGMKRVRVPPAPHGTYISIIRDYILKFFFDYEGVGFRRDPLQPFSSTFLNKKIFDFQGNQPPFGFHGLQNVEISTNF